MAIEGIFYVHAKVTDLQRAKQFYGETLGWKLHTDEPYVAGSGSAAVTWSPVWKRARHRSRIAPEECTSQCE
jgi:catechol 2,3-dioxygenase-like lactoylglutathione lyase family enzyme